MKWEKKRREVMKQKRKWHKRTLVQKSQSWQQKIGLFSLTLPKAFCFMSKVPLANPEDLNFLQLSKILMARGDHAKRVVTKCPYRKLSSVTLIIKKN